MVAICVSMIVCCSSQVLPDHFEDIAHAKAFKLQMKRTPRVKPWEVPCPKNLRVTMICMIIVIISRYM